MFIVQEHLPVAIQNNQTLVMASMNGVSSQVGECKVKLGSANIKSGERFVACHRQREHGSCFQRNTPPPPHQDQRKLKFYLGGLCIFTQGWANP